MYAVLANSFLFSQLWTVEVTTLMPESFRSTFGVFTASVKLRSAVCDKEFRDFQLLDRHRLSPEKKSTRAPLESSHVTPRRLRSHVFRNKRESKTPCCLGASSRVFQPSQFQKSLWKLHTGCFDVCDSPTNSETQSS